MDEAKVFLNDPSRFDELCHGKDCLPDAGELTLVSKDVGTVQGRPCVLLTHLVQLPDGSIRRAQTTITGRMFAMMAAAFRGRYGLEGDRVCVQDPKSE